MKILSNKKLNSGLNIAIRSGALLFPALAFAQTPTVKISTVSGLVSLICVVFGWMFYTLIALSLVVILMAAFNYVTAGDNSEKVSKANRMILYAAIGIAVAILAKGLPLIVGDFLSASGSLAAC
jgi:uncharacterized membrane protein